LSSNLFFKNKDNDLSKNELKKWIWIFKNKDYNIFEYLKEIDLSSKKYLNKSIDNRIFDEDCSLLNDILKYSKIERINLRGSIKIKNRQRNLFKWVANFEG
jgi:hypothetical protein